MKTDFVISIFQSSACRTTDNNVKRVLQVGLESHK